MAAKAKCHVQAGFSLIGKSLCVSENLFLVRKSTFAEELPVSSFYHILLRYMQSAYYSSSKYPNFLSDFGRNQGYTVAFTIKEDKSYNCLSTRKTDSVMMTRCVGNRVAVSIIQFERGRGLVLFCRP